MSLRVACRSVSWVSPLTEPVYRLGSVANETVEELTTLTLEGPRFCICSVRILASRAWARLVPALNKLSDRHLAFLAKDFFAAGWTVRDLITALDTLPDGRAQGQIVDGRWVPYSGADGIPAARLGHWVNWRLNAWRDNGAVVESATQKRQRRAKTAKAQQAALQRAREEEWQRKKAELATPEGQAEKQAALQKIRQLRRQRKFHR